MAPPKKPTPPAAAREGQQSPRKGRGGLSNEPEQKDAHAFRSDLEEAQASVRKVLASTLFDAAIGVVIVLNALTIGVEQTLALNDHSLTGVRVVESCFLAIYVLELCARFFGHSWRCLWDKWVELDIVLIMLGVVNSWILEPAMDNPPNEMTPLMILRTLRLLRLAKTARLLGKVQEFRMLVRGLFHSSTVMVYTLMVLIAVLYCFSILAIELITKNSLAMGERRDAEFRTQVDKFFPSVHRTMLTLVQFVTLDQTTEVYTLLCEKDPWLTIYFVALLLIVSIILMNLVAAVIFSSTIDANQKELDDVQHIQEKDWGSFIANLKSMFNRIDEDKSGTLTLDELMAIDKKDQQALSQALDMTTPLEIFKFLDPERTGEVSINEFFDCILDKILQSGDVNLKRMERQIETMHWRLKETFSAQNEISIKILAMQEQLTATLAASRSHVGQVEGNGHDHPSSSSNRKGSTDSLWPFQLGQTKEVKLLAKPQVERSRSPKHEVPDRELDAWEADLCSKLRPILEEGMRAAFDSLRGVADSARARAPSPPPPMMMEDGPTMVMAPSVPPPGAPPRRNSSRGGEGSPAARKRVSLGSGQQKQRQTTPTPPQSPEGPPGSASDPPLLMSTGSNNPPVAMKAATAAPPAPAEAGAPEAAQRQGVHL